MCLSTFSEQADKFISWQVSGELRQISPHRCAECRVECPLTPCHSLGSLLGSKSSFEALAVTEPHGSNQHTKWFITCKENSHDDLKKFGISQMNNMVFELYEDFWIFMMKIYQQTILSIFKIFCNEMFQIILWHTWTLFQKIESHPHYLSLKCLKKFPFLVLFLTSNMTSRFLSLFPLNNKTLVSINMNRRLLSQNFCHSTGKRDKRVLAF